MPGFYPASTYPFALQFLVFFGSLFFTVFEDRWMSNQKQIIIGFATQCVLLILVPIFANVGGSTGYWLVFMTLIVLGWFSGIVQSCLYQENAKLPGRYIGIFLTSQGLGGIFTNIFRFCTLKIWPDSPFISASACYLIAVLVCLLCIPAQINMKKNSFAQYYQNKTINLEVQPQPQTVFIVPMEV